MGLLLAIVSDVIRVLSSVQQTKPAKERKNSDTKQACLEALAGLYRNFRLNSSILKLVDTPTVDLRRTIEDAPEKYSVKYFSIMSVFFFCPVDVKRLLCVNVSGSNVLGFDRDRVR